MILREFTEGIVDSAVQFHKELNPKIWQGDVLKPTVRFKLLQIAKHFIEFIDIPELNLKDITISGSNAAFSYTEHSDLDLHLVVDVSPERELILKPLYDAKKNQYNFNHDIKIKGIDVELYVQPSTDKHHSLGIYSVLDNKWISQPIMGTVKINDSDVKRKVDNYLNKIMQALTDDDVDNVKEIQQEISKLRKAGLETNGEFSIENIAFKILRAKGFIDQLRQHIYKLQDKALSLETTMKVSEAHGNSKIYDKCWDGYKKVPGKKRGEKGSCVKEDAQANAILSKADTLLQGTGFARQGFAIVKAPQQGGVRGSITDEALTMVKNMLAKAQAMGATDSPNPTPIQQPSQVANKEFGEAHGNSKVKEGSETDRDRKLAEIGRKMMDMAVTEKNDELANKLSVLGDALTRYGTTFGPRSVEELVKVTGIEVKLIKLMMDLANKRNDTLSKVKDPKDTDEAMETGKITDIKPGQSATIQTGPGVSTTIDLKANPTALTKDETGKLKLVMKPQTPGGAPQSGDQQTDVPKTGDEVEIDQGLESIKRLAGVQEVQSTFPELEYKVAELMKQFEQDAMEIGAYGDPDIKGIVSLIAQGDYEGAADEVYGSFADKDGDEPRRLEPYIQDLQSEFEALSDMLGKKTSHDLESIKRLAGM